MATKPRGRGINIDVGKTNMRFKGTHVPEGHAEPETPESENPRGPRSRAGKIGLGKPLSVKIVSMFPGQRDRGRETLVTSAVRSPEIHGSTPLAMHYYFSKTDYGVPLQPTADAPGSNVIYYTDGAVDDSLDVTVRMSFDAFNEERFKAYTTAVSKAAKLPVFLASVAGGPLAVAGAQAMISAGESGLNILWRIFDRIVDGDNDWTATWRLNLNANDRDLSKPGYILLRGDGEGTSDFVPIYRDENGNSAVELVTPDKAFVVNTGDGTLRYAADPERQVDDDEPYLLAFVEGTKNPGLDKWATAAVSSSLMEHFLGKGGDGATDLTEILEAYNDLMFSKTVRSIDIQLADATAGSTEAKALQAKREGALKNIQNGDLKAVLKTT